METYRKQDHSMDYCTHTCPPCTLRVLNSSLDIFLKEIQLDRGEERVDEKQKREEEVNFTYASAARSSCIPGVTHAYPLFVAFSFRVTCSHIVAR